MDSRDLEHALALYLGEVSPAPMEWLVTAFRRAVRHGRSIEDELHLGGQWRGAVRRVAGRAHITRAATAMSSSSTWNVAVVIDSKLRELRRGSTPRDAVDAELAAALMVAAGSLPTTPEGIYEVLIRSAPRESTKKPRPSR